jgi:exonuclease SbcC
MFLSLQYSVTFPSQRELKADLNFTNGFTAITGPNESGKSMVFEMLRYLLFGSQALRGVADDYKTLVASGSVMIRGVQYDIVRGKRVTIKRGPDIIATGTTAVNAKVVELLGFGLSVFDVACSINQGEVERLGSMTAAERKRLVDGVLGIDGLDIMTKWGLEEARVLDREAEAIKSTLTTPVHPGEPVPMIFLDTFKADADELQRIKGWLSYSRTQPVAPSPTPEVTEEQAESAKAMRQLKAQIDVLPTSALSVEGMDWEAYDAAQDWLKANPVGKYTVEQLQQFMEDHYLINEWMDYEDDLGEHLEIERLIEGVDHVDCPKCEHHFPLSPDRLASLEARRTARPSAPSSPKPKLPPITLEAADAEHQRLLGIRHLTRVVMESVEKPALSRSQIESEKQKAKQVELRKELEAQYAPTEDYETGRMQWGAYQQALVNFIADNRAYESWIAERLTQQERAAELEGADLRLAGAQLQHQQAVAYEAALARYTLDVERYDEGVQRIETLEAQALQHRKVRDLMNLLRSLIKQHLMPSLNKVASHLLSGMTGGQRNIILVDEDFNVMVDGQRLDTLSGSGKACANLAIRIALGQVLTNKVISVLLADEIDASMDEFRSQETSKILGILENSISQVMLVSHKSIEATHQISLGGFIDQYPAEGGGS